MRLLVTTTVAVEVAEWPDCDGELLPAVMSALRGHADDGTASVAIDRVTPALGVDEEWPAFDWADVAS